MVERGKKREEAGKKIGYTANENRNIDKLIRAKLKILEPVLVTILNHRLMLRSNRGF